MYIINKDIYVSSFNFNIAVVYLGLSLSYLSLSSFINFIGVNSFIFIRSNFNSDFYGMSISLACVQLPSFFSRLSLFPLQTPSFPIFLGGGFMISSLRLNCTTSRIKLHYLCSFMSAILSRVCRLPQRIPIEHQN